MSVIGRSRGPWGSSLAAWEASGGVRRGPGRPQKATVCVADCTPTRVNVLTRLPCRGFTIPDAAETYSGLAVSVETTSRTSYQRTYRFGRYPALDLCSVDSPTRQLGR